MEQESQIRAISRGNHLPGLAKAELSLLRRKQTKLASTQAAMLASLLLGPHHRNALEATLIFACYEAGTAVCIHPEGWILTCAHCIGEDEAKRQENRRPWLLTYTNITMQAEYYIWDLSLDLALLRIVSVEGSTDGKSAPIAFPHIQLASQLPKRSEAIICIGQPGKDDLESTARRKTTYNLLEVSEGRFRGMVPGVDPRNNSEIGSLKHDA
ncbi:MAG: hypothetical protein Q9226_004539 [Calogaya cf. arnoldii]